MALTQVSSNFCCVRLRVDQDKYIDIHHFPLSEWSREVVHESKCECTFKVFHALFDRKQGEQIMYFVCVFYPFPSIFFFTILSTSTRN
uniref:Uncharacterized protein n=1 Tax=Solanum lycopersicum TaxID=4081 RepID=A0A3Q7HRT2_SOLLC